MNPDEIKNLVATLAVGLGGAWAASHGIDQATVSSVAAGAVSLLGGLYSVWSHWNQIKVPEASTVIPPKK